MASPSIVSMGHSPTPNTSFQGGAIPAGSMGDASGLEDGVVIRAMRLKVLYTFDDQNKTNCLARWPDILQIKTISIDETLSIGIVELKTCLQAIIQCSPELMARMGTDYTIYAYDYSEYDTPLVGQGMLSRAMAAASPTPNAPASESGQLITGRICKNILGIFTNGVKETLEVKLRLVPVPKAVEAQYLDSMREINKSMPTGLESMEWNAFMQQNMGMGQMGQAGQMVNMATPPGSQNIYQRDGRSMEVVNQLLSPQVSSQGSVDPFNQANMNPEIPDNVSVGNSTKPKSRPGSRASVKRPRARKPKLANAGGNTSGYEEGTDGDEGPAPKKKRARVTKADQKNSKSAFSTAPDSLRVAASTAGSLRLFRPIAAAGGSVGGHLQDGPPRAPTPVPGMLSGSHARAASQGSLRHELRNSIETANPSPERNYSPEKTPVDIGSSPPVMRTRPVTPAGMNSSPPCASSPVLPQMPRTDSGFMSASLEELFGEDEAFAIDDEAEAEPAERIERPHSTQRPSAPVFGDDFEIRECMPGPIELLPTKMPIFEPPASTESRARAATSRANSIMSEDGQALPPLKKGRPPLRKNSKAPPKEKKMSSRKPSPAAVSGHSMNDPQITLPQQQEVPIPQQQTPPIPEGQVHPASVPPTSRPGSRGGLTRNASMGALTFPTMPVGEAALPPSNLHRSQTWSENPQPAYEMPMMPEVQPEYTNETSARFASKKAAIRQKLEEAIARGEMPPYCSNCGAIDTPTWRKSWATTMQGAPGYYDYSDEPGRVTAIVILTRNDDGTPTSYQLIKKFLSPTECKDDYKEFMLCNPCGIWMSKYKTQRPPSRWESGAPVEKPRGGPKRVRARAKKPQNSGMPTSEANYPPSEANYTYSEAIFPQSEAYYTQSEVMRPPEGLSNMDGANETQQTALGPVNGNQARRGSMTKVTTSGTASAALRRAIQSSPARWAGTRNSPINVEEDDLGETRRLLFPSPRKDNSPKVLGDVITNVNVVTISSDLRFPKEIAMEIQNKENFPPALDMADIDSDILKMFEEEMSKNESLRPKTPVRESPTSNPFKTPTRPTPSHRPITRSVSRSQRSGKSPRQLLTFNKTPSRTPRRSPRNHETNFESPFTRTLNELMNGGNQNQLSPSGRNRMELDFGTLPELPNIDHDQQGMGMGFSLEDFFSTDVIMPSSPPGGHGHGGQGFSLYDEGMGLEGVDVDGVDWSQFGEYDGRDVGAEAHVGGSEVALSTEHSAISGEQVVVKTEVEESPRKKQAEGTEGKVQAVVDAQLAGAETQSA